MDSKRLLLLHQESRLLFSRQLKVLHDYRISKSKEEKQLLKKEYSNLISEEEKLNQKLHYDLRPI